MFKWIKAADLQRWAARDVGEASRVFPQLVSDLISALPIRLEVRNVPTGAQITLQGFDGDVRRSDDDLFTEYVPSGHSVWELGVDDNYRGKAQEDFDKRADEETLFDKKSVTFVFATPRIWEKRSKKEWQKERWAEEKRKESVWKDVRVVDAIILEEWLARCPAIAADFARRCLGNVPSIGAYSVSEALDSYSKFCDPELSDGVVFAGRQKEMGVLVSRLKSGCAVTIVEGENSRAAEAFVAATVRQSRRSFDATALGVRTLIVDKAEAVSQLEVTSSLICVLVGDAVEALGKIVGKCTIIIARGAGVENKAFDISVKNPPEAFTFAQALEATMGVDPREAYRLAKATMGSLTNLRRLLGQGTPPPPAWFDNLPKLLPAFLLGGWDSNNEFDIVALKTLCGFGDIAEYLELVRCASDEQGRICVVEASTWKIRPQMLGLYYASLDDVDVERTLEVIDAVFCSSEYGDRHSSGLRAGLALSIAFICGSDVRAAHVISQHIGKKCFVDIVEAYRAFGSELTLLVEAAPEAFLEALKNGLKTDNFSKQYRAAEIGGQRYFRYQVVCSLRKLAWSSRYRQDVVDILTRLVSWDEVNHVEGARPALTALFLPGSAECDTVPSRRNRHLGEVTSQLAPEDSWKFIVSLLPDPYSAEPFPIVNSIRNFEKKAPGDKGAARWEEYWIAIANTACDLAGYRVDRWSAILESLRGFPRTVGQHIVEGHKDKLRQVFSKNDELWLTGYEFAQKHFCHREQWWALQSCVYEQIFEILESVRPSRQLRVRSLYECGVVKEVWQAGESISLKDAKNETICDLYSHEGLPGLLELAGTVKCTGDFCASVELLNLSAVEMVALILSIFESEGELSGSHGAALYLAASRRLGRKFCLLPFENEGKWRKEWLVKLLRTWPQNSTTWDYARDLGLEGSLWQALYTIIPENSFDAKRVFLAFKSIEKLELAHFAMERFPSEFSFDDYCLMIRRLNELSTDIRNYSYECAVLLTSFSNGGGSNEARIALELMASLSLDGGRARAVRAEMVVNGTFFASIYLQSMGVESADGSTKSFREWQFYREIVQSFFLTAQIGKNSHLQSWVDEALARLLKEMSRHEAEALVASALCVPVADTDGLWLIKSVRDFVQKSGRESRFVQIFTRSALLDLRLPKFLDNLRQHSSDDAELLATFDEWPVVQAIVEQVLCLS